MCNVADLYWSLKFQYSKYVPNNVSTFKYRVSCTDGKILVRINLFFYLIEEFYCRILCKGTVQGIVEWMLLHESHFYDVTCVMPSRCKLKFHAQDYGLLGGVVRHFPADAGGV